MRTQQKPVVRDDQHGTVTGYAYGCRCNDCRGAAREYGKTPRVSQDAIDLIFAALEREADMDDVSTASNERLGEVAGVSGRTADRAIHALANAGRITILGRSAGVGGALVIRLGGAS